MKDPERFNEVIETLLDDRSPARQARYLDPAEQRMLILAQRIRGSRGETVSAESLLALRREMRTHHVSHP